MRELVEQQGGASILLLSWELGYCGNIEIDVFSMTLPPVWLLSYHRLVRKGGYESWPEQGIFFP
jgi:hypothetical protein